MIVYNITMKVPPSIEKEWLEWEKNEHIPEVMQTGLFTDFKLFHLLEQDESEGKTYVLQYYASSLKNYQQYLEKHVPLLREKITDKWGDRFSSFGTIMEIVN